MFSRLWQRLVRFAFRLLYNEMAWSYDVVSWLVSLGAWREWQRAALPFVTGHHILEIGHGPGHMLLALQGHGRHIFGIDLSPAMGRMAQKRVAQAQVAAPLARARVQALPFGPAVFDTVLSTFPTEYIVDPDTLTAVYRVLKPGGRLLIVPEGHTTGTGLVPRLLDWLFRITGQRDGPFAVAEEKDWPGQRAAMLFESRFTAVGFQIKIKPIPLKGSAVTVIIAQKGEI